VSLAPDPAAVVDRLLSAIEAGDVETVRATYSPDATIWHNHDGVAQTVDENLRVLTWLVARTTTRTYEEIRRYPFDGGIVQQHVLRIGFDDGRSAALPAALFVWVDGDRVKRIEEYLDAAGAATAFM
jgi:ketosteroid isomerase-like protein